MSLRPLVPSDIPALAAAVAALPLMQRYRRDAAALAHDFTAALARGDGFLVDDDHDGRGARGLVWFLPSATFAAGGYLRFIALVPGQAGARRGDALLAAFETAVAAHSRHAFLLVSDFNTDAQRFYQRHGYSQVGALPGFVLPDVAELIYWKRLR